MLLVRVQYWWRHRRILTTQVQQSGSSHNLNSSTGTGSVGGNSKRPYTSSGNGAGTAAQDAKRAATGASTPQPLPSKVLQQGSNASEAVGGTAGVALPAGLPKGGGTAVGIDRQKAWLLPKTDLNMLESILEKKADGLFYIAKTETSN